ncbi:MAG: hypothetical protein ACTHU0_39435 [Kofleriaceae bacterium]
MRALFTIAAVALAAGCKPAPEPKISARCAPNAARAGVECTATNTGNGAGRACLAVILEARTGPRLFGRRVCTASLAPQESKPLTPIFEENVARRCIRMGQWDCKIVIDETSSEVGEAR